jgi:DNA polymerase I-like protein with 3'-5' exonuclease and polymerase domains
MTPTFLRTALKFPLPQSSDKKVFLFDIETNGFYDDVNTIHCIVIKDVKTGQTFSYGPDSISNALIHLDSADTLIGHNIIFYDIPVIEKLFPDVIDFASKEVVDTLVCVRLLWPKEKLYEIDQKDYNHVPSRLMGSASLEAWGQRFKDYKGDFKDFENFSQEMLNYCIQDVSVSFRLYELLCDQAGPYERSLRLEHDLARCIERQIRSGFGFDVDAANDLVDELEKRKGELEFELREAFPAKDEGDWFVPRVNNKNKGYVAGEKVWRSRIVEFNPGSRQQICERLKEKYGWIPTATTDKGNPIVDDEVLEKLIYPEAKSLSEYMLVKKRLGQIKDGANGWLKLVTDDNYIHGDLITNGCITGRASHMSPNMAQIPAGYSPFGKECRSLFIPPDGFNLIGVDAKALELRCLAGYLAMVSMEG